jgi:hypothetical protein
VLNSSQIFLVNQKYLIMTFVESVHECPQTYVSHERKSLCTTCQMVEVIANTPSISKYLSPLIFYINFNHSSY